MRLKGRAPGGIPSLTTQTDDNGTVIGSVKLPVGHIIAIPGQPGIPGEDGDDGTDGQDGQPGQPGADGEVTLEQLNDAIDAILGGATNLTNFATVESWVANFDETLVDLSYGVENKQPKFMTGTSSTAAGTVAKTVTLDAPRASYTPVAGDWLLITFTNGVNAANPTLNVNGSGANSIRTPSGIRDASSTYVVSGGTMLLQVVSSGIYQMVGTNAYYAEITDAEIVNTTHTGARVISGRRAEYLMANEANKARTLTNKTLTDAKLNRLVATGGNWVLEVVGGGGANRLQVVSAAAGTAPSVGASSGSADTDVDFNVTTKGAGVVRANNIPVVTTTGVQTLTNKTLTSPTITMGTKKIENLGDPVNDQDAATRAWVLAQLALMVDGSPGTLDTLNELAAAIGDDPNFAATMVAAMATKALKTTTISAGTGLSGGGDLSANRTLSVTYGTTAGTAAQGNDSRLSDARTPTAHGHVISDVTGLQTAIDAKLDKVTTPSRMYLVDSEGNQGVAPYSSGLTPNSVVTRDDNNTFQVGTPTAAGHAATKAYVDTAVSGVSSGGSPVTAATAAVATGESTTSSTYTSLATTTDQVTVTVGASGILQVTINSQLTCSTVHQMAYVSFELSGANTLAADDARCFWLKNPVSGGSGFRYGMTKVLTGLAPGATTVKMKYKASSGTSTFTLREVSAVAF